MNWKKTGFIAGISAGVFIGMKYIFPVMLPFLVGWILSQSVHPLAAYLAGKKLSRKLHFSECGIGAGIILLLTVIIIGSVFIGAEYLMEKIGSCLKYYPLIKKEGDLLIRRCCLGAERLTGIPAGRSRSYLYQQLSQVGRTLLTGGKGMNTAVHSVKCCILMMGMLLVSVISSVLFLQEREKIIRFVEKQPFCRRIHKVSREIAKGIREYLKAQIKIMGIVIILCAAGLWMLKIRSFLELGIFIGILDAFPVLGTGMILIPGGVLLLLQGKTVSGVGFFLLYVVTSVARQLLEPKFVGSQVGVSPLLVLLSVYLGIFLYGGFGFILGPLSGLLLYGIIREWEEKVD